MVHEYFKKDLKEGIILIQINPHTFEGIELLIAKTGEIQKTLRNFDEEIYDDLAYDAFERGNPLEFNLYLQKV